MTRAFSSEVDTGSREENASKQESRAPFRFYRNGKGSSSHRLSRLHRIINPGVLGVFCVRVASAGLAYALFAAVGHTTSLETYNQFAVLFSLMNFMGPIGSLGSTPLVFKYWPAFGNAESQGRTEFLSSLIKLVFLAGLMASAVAVLFSLRSVHGSYGLYGTIACSVLVLALTELFFAVFRVTRSVLAGVLVKELLWRLLFLGVLAIAYRYHFLISITAVTTLFLFANLFTLVIFLVGSRSYLSLKLLVRPTATLLPPTSQIATFFLLSLISIATIHLDTLLLSVRGPSTELGAFFSAQRIIQVLYFFSQSIGIFASPVVASDFAKKDFANITRQSRLAALGGLVITVPSALILILFSDQILGLFRPEFKDYWPIIAALSVGPIVYTALIYQSIIPIYCGEEKRYLLGRITIIVVLIPIKLITITYSPLLVYSVVCSMEIILTSLFGAFISSRYCKVAIV
jgi:O-antigen/teichoic acid export membrane protein